MTVSRRGLNNHGPMISLGAARLGHRIAVELPGVNPNGGGWFHPAGRLYTLCLVLTLI